MVLAQGPARGDLGRWVAVAAQEHRVGVTAAWARAQGKVGLCLEQERGDLFKEQGSVFF
jgi:hypothetical protein